MKWKRYFSVWSVLVAIFYITGCASIDASREYQLGLDAYNAKNYKAGLAHLDQALAHDPAYTPAKDLKPWVQFKLNQVKQAEDSFAKVYEEKPNDINAIQGLAWIAYMKGDFDKSTDLFKKEKNWAENHINNSDWEYYETGDQDYIVSIYSDANYGLGLISKKMGRNSDADKYFRRALKNNNNFMEKSKIYIDLADVLIAEKNYPDAARMLAKAVTVTDNADYHLLLPTGWTHYWAGEYEKADEFFKKAITIDSKRPDAQYAMGTSLFGQKKFKEAKAYLKKAIELNPYFMEGASVYSMIKARPEYRTLWKDFGLAYYRLVNYQAARYKLSLYLQSNPEDFDALLAGGWSSRWTGLTVEAKAAFDKAAGLKPGKPGPHVGLGSTLLAAGKISAAEGEFRKALSIDQNHAGALNGIGHYFLITGDKRRARESFKDALNANADDSDSLAQLAGLFFQEKDYNNAAYYYQRQIDLNPRLVLPHNMLGWSYYNTKRYEEAKEKFLHSKQLNPYLADCYYGLGLSYYSLDKKDEARQALSTAIQIAPAYSHARKLEDLMAANPDWESLRLTLGWSYYRYRSYPAALKAFEASGISEEPGTEPLRGRAWSHYWLGQYDQAFPLFKELSKQNANDVDALIGMGWVLFNQRKHDQSKAVMEKVVKINPKLTRSWRTIAAIEYIKGRHDKARSIYDKIEKLEPRATDIHNNTGWSFFTQRRYAEAIEEFQKSVKIAYNLGEPHYGLGLSYLHTGEIKSAQKELQTAIYLYPAYMDGPSFYDIMDNNSELTALTNDLGWSYFYKQYYKAALFHFDRMFKKKPGFVDAALGKGATLYMLGDFDKAGETYGQLMNQVPGSGKSWDKWSNMLNNLGWGHYYKKAYRQAIATFEHLQKYHPDIKFIAPMNGLGWCYLKLGNKSKAKGIFEESLQIIPGNYLAESGLLALMD